MADSPQAVAEGKVRRETAKAVGEAIRNNRERKDYGHVMTDEERFALQVCIKARTALNAVGEHIKRGKGCNPEILKAALLIQSEAASVLFAK